MFLSLETLISVIRTGLPILVEVIKLVNSVIIFLSEIGNDFTQMVNVPTRIPDCDSLSFALLDLFLSSDASICSIMAFPPLGILIMLLSQIRLTFYRLYSGMPCFIALLMTIFVLFGMDFIKIGEISHGRISLS